MKWKPAVISIQGLALDSSNMVSVLGYVPLPLSSSRSELHPDEDGRKSEGESHNQEPERMNHHPWLRELLLGLSLLSLLFLPFHSVMLLALLLAVHDCLSCAAGRPEFSPV